MQAKTHLSLASLLLLGGLSPALAQEAPKPKAAPAPKVIKVDSAAATGSALPLTNAEVSEVPGVDMSKLNFEQKKLAIKIFTDAKCTCPCGMTLLDCRTKDQKCPVSPGICKGVVDNILAGKTEAEIREGFAPKLLETKVNAFDYTGSPFHGPADAKVVLAEFSDFQ